MWGVTTGVISWWADESLRDVGRLRYRAARDGGQVPQGTRPPQVDHALSAFVARRKPWRLSIVDLGQDSTSVMWADAETAVMEGQPVVGRILTPSEGWGDLGLSLLLLPQGIREEMKDEWSDESVFEIAGSHVNELQPAASLITLGADYYKIQYDARQQIITEWTAMVDGTPAASVTLSNLVILDSWAPVSTPVRSCSQHRNA